MITLYYYFMAKDTLTHAQSEILLRAIMYKAFSGVNEVFAREPNWHRFAGAAFDQGRLTVSYKMFEQLDSNINKVRDACSPFLDALVIYHEENMHFEVPDYPDVEHKVIPVISGSRDTMRLMRVKMLKHLTGNLDNAINNAFQI